MKARSVLGVIACARGRLHPTQQPHARMHAESHAVSISTLRHAWHVPLLHACIPPCKPFQQGVQMQPPEVSQFQHHVVNGEWEAAQRLLPALAGGAGVLQQATFLVSQCISRSALSHGICVVHCSSLLSWLLES